MAIDPFVNHSPPIVAIIIARLTSSRLPGKQLRLIAGKPMIYHVIARLKKVAGLDKIVLATASKRENQALADYVGQFDIPTYFDDDENDVTGRIARAANRFEAENIVTVSGDCPLIEPAFLEKGIRLLTENNADYVFLNKKKYKCLHEGIGFFRNSLWQALDKHSTTWFHKEHPGSVLPEIESQFQGVEIIPEPQFRRNDFRLSVDTASDLEFMNFVFDNCEQNDEIVELADVVSLVDEKPFVKNINGHVHQKGLTEKSNKVTIVTQADEKVGMGHLARSMALARELKESQAINVNFYVNDNPGANQLLERQGFSTSVWKSLDDLSEKLRSGVQQVDGAVIDLKASCCDDLLEKTGRLDTCSMLVDYVPSDASLGDLFILPTVSFDYENKASHFAKKKILTGKNHLLLNRKISWLRERDDSREGVLVTAGGSGLLSDELFSALSTLSRNEKIIFLAGPFADESFFHQKTNAHNFKKYEVIFNPPDVFDVYSKSKLALCTFGVTTYELIALGVPTVVVKTVTADDVELVESLAQSDVCINLLDQANSPEVVTATLESLLQNSERLTELSLNSKKFIDGLGVQRVGVAIKELIS